jgi:hypothetical protein
MVGIDDSPGWTRVVGRSWGNVGIGTILCRPRKLLCASPGDGRGVWAGVTANGVGA